MLGIVGSTTTPQPATHKPTNTTDQHTTTYITITNKQTYIHNNNNNNNKTNINKDRQTYIKTKSRRNGQQQ